MINMTRPEIFRTLSTPPACRPRRLGFGIRRRTPPSDPRIEVLVEMALDLMMEVEALRGAHLAPDSTAPDSRAGYASAYRDTAYLTHNNCGPSGGIEKLLGLFYPAEAVASRDASGEQRTWRECLMLERLGLSEEQLREYEEEAEQAELFT